VPVLGLGDSTEGARQEGVLVTHPRTARTTTLAEGAHAQAPAPPLAPPLTPALPATRAPPAPRAKRDWVGFLSPPIF
jgi:hypothetical protein